MTLSDLELLGEIFSNTKRRGVSLRQLSFLFVEIWRFVYFKDVGHPPSGI